MVNGGRDFRPKKQQGEEPRVNNEDLSKIIEAGDAKKLNEITRKLGEYYARGEEREKLSSSQIRNILDRLQRLPKYDPNELQLLRPLFAYAAGKATTSKEKVKHLQRIMDNAIQKVDSEDKFKNLKNFFEAIVAYHRYYGGK